MDSRDRAALTRTLQAIYREIGRAADAAIQRFAPGGRVLPRNGGTGTSQGAEPPLGTPASDGDALVSTAAGVRSWAWRSTFDPAATILPAGDCHDAGTLAALLDDLFCRLRDLETATGGYGLGPYGSTPYGE